MIKKIILSLLLLAFASVPSMAAADKGLTILYTADVLGEVKPKSL